MRRNKEKLMLGGGFSLRSFVAFNTVMVTVWTAFKILQVYAIVGVGVILATGTEVVTSSPLGQLGMAFVNLTYGLSLLLLALFLIVIWVFGIIYLIRKELYCFMKSYFRWGDL